MMAGLYEKIQNLGGETVTEMKNDALDLDVEWVLLILEAKRLGIQKDEVRKFLHHKGRPNNENALL